MLKHILKLIWTQRRNNVWVFIELLLVFVLLWRSLDSLLMQGITAFQPEGVSVENVYKVTLAMRPSTSSSYITYEKGSNEPGTNLLRIIDRLREHPDVESVAISDTYSLPFTYSNNNRSLFNDSIGKQALIYTVTPDYFRVFDIRTADGQSPERLAKQLSEGLVISQTLATGIFGDEDPVGRKVTYEKGDSTFRHVSAVTAPIKKKGVDQPQEAFFEYLKESNIYRASEQELTTFAICFRTRSGVEGSANYADRFKKEMKQSLSAGNFWLADVQYYADLRSHFLDNSMEMNGRRLTMAINLFFLVNVFLAVIGTFWFRISRRRGELGLRMAVGSTRHEVHRLVTGEGLLILTLVAIPALLLCFNLAYLDFLSTDVMPVTVFRLALVSLLTWAILAATIMLAVWYPARKAARLEPAEALHYE